MNDKDRNHYKVRKRTIGFMIPNVFGTDPVTTAADAFEAAFGQQDSAVGSRIAANVDFNDEMAQMIALKATVGHMVPNFCSGNPGAIAAWSSAAHVEKAPKAKPKPPTP